MLVVVNHPCDEFYISFAILEKSILEPFEVGLSTHVKDNFFRKFFVKFNLPFSILGNKDRKCVK